eukprot:Rmarinus@m.24488
MLVHDATFCDVGEFGDGNSVSCLPFIENDIFTLNGPVDFQSYVISLNQVYFREDWCFDHDLIFVDSLGCHTNPEDIVGLTFADTRKRLDITEAARWRTILGPSSLGSDLLKEALRGSLRSPLVADGMAGVVTSILPTGTVHYRIEGTVLSLVSLWDSAYYHVIVQVLTRVLAAETLLTKDVRVLATLPHRWPHESFYKMLGVVGIHPSQVIPYERGAVYEVEHALVPSMPPCDGVVSSLVRELRLRFLRAGYLPWSETNRERFLSTPMVQWKLSDVDPRPDVIIVASRNNDLVRRFLQQEDVVSYIRQAVRGRNLLTGAADSVEIYEWEEGMQVDEIARRFSRAKALFGPHGAGLTNALFMPPQTTVIELMMEQPQYYYRDLAEALFLKHAQIQIAKSHNMGHFHTNQPVLLAQTVLAQLYSATLDEIRTWYVAGQG